MRLKDKNIMKGISSFRGREKNKNLLLAALRYYTSTFFRYDMSSSQQNIPIPSGACLRHLSGFFMGSPFLEAEKMKGIQNPCFNNKVMLIIKI